MVNEFSIKILYAYWIEQIDTTVFTKMTYVYAQWCETMRSFSPNITNKIARRVCKEPDGQDNTFLQNVRTFIIKYCRD